MKKIFKEKSTKVFVISFILLNILLGVRFYLLDMVDSGMWGHQAEYILSGDSQQFDFLGAYGHPGGTIVEGTILLQKITNTRSYFLVLILVSILCSTLGALSALLCEKLKKDSFWWMGVVITLGLTPFYESATPTSAVAAIGVSALTLLTFYILENGNSKKLFVYWGMLSGFVVATRFDIGTLSSFIYFLVLLKKGETRNILKALLASFSTFVIFDPYMWYMPIRHIKDLVYKIFFHYSEFSIWRIDKSVIIFLSLFAFISFILSILSYTKLKKNIKVLPIKLWLGMTSLALIVYGMFLTSNFQAERYLMPVVLIWEIFLSLYILKLINNTNFKNKFLLKISFLIILGFCYASFFIQTLVVNHSFNLL